MKVALPSQLRMSRDVPGDGFYLSGLGSFASRTCYANSSGDHLVRSGRVVTRPCRRPPL